MANLTIKHGETTITVRESIGSDIFDEDLVMTFLGDEVKGHPFYRVQQYRDAVVRSVVQGNLGFEWPESVVDKTRIYAAYESWRRLPKALLRDWAKALNDVNTPPGDPDLQPLPEGKELPPP